MLEQANRKPKLSIVNARHPDPPGSAYAPPVPGREWWEDPDGERVTVDQVMAGADPETRMWIYNETMACFNATYQQGFERAETTGKRFRGGNVEHLLAELRGQLGTKHWITSSGR